VRLSPEQQRWDELANLDPYWAVLPCSEGIGQWDVQAYLESARPSIADLMRRATEFGHPVKRFAALDFGCGAGRLTRALAEHFEQSVGVDISEQMVAEACRVNADVPNTEFRANVEDDLRIFDDGRFDVVHTTSSSSTYRSGRRFSRMCASS
jgi:SAM-dependent methyltransferase